MKVRYEVTIHDGHFAVRNIQLNALARDMDGTVILFADEAMAHEFVADLLNRGAEVLIEHTPSRVTN